MKQRYIELHVWDTYNSATCEMLIFWSRFVISKGRMPGESVERNAM